jgi:Superinfection immunity protein
MLIDEMEPYHNSAARGPAAAPGWYPLHGELCYWDGQQWTEYRRAMRRQPVTYRGYAQSGTLITDSRTNLVELALAWILTVLTLGYFLPWAIAATRGKSNSAAVGLVTFLLGWTFIGWVVALVMACSSHQVAGIRG